MPPIPPLPSTGGSRSPTRPDCRRLVFLWSIAAGALVPVYFLAVADVSHVA